MEVADLLKMVSMGETSKVQFKEKITHDDSIAAEMVAMSNSLGGTILIGVKDKTGEILGADVSTELNERLANIATNNVNPPIYLTTEAISIKSGKAEKNVLAIHIAEGINKPYKLNSGAIWIKQGSDKRRVTDNSEILRLFQASSNLFADEMEVYDTSIEDIDGKKFEEYFIKEFGRPYQERNLSYEQALRAKRIIKNGKLTLAGLLFFGKFPQTIKPAFTLKAVSFVGNELEGTTYRSKPKDMTGTIPELFDKGMSFFTSNLKYLQTGKSFNTPGKLEVSQIALEELLQNALLHRDYFKNAPIRLMIFDNRIEIISPGKLPNSLSIEDIKYGNPVIRNNQLVAFGIHTLPFSGLGSGIKRSLEEQPDIELINDLEGDQFIAKIPRTN